MATSPNYAGTPRIGVATISTANTNRDGTGTITQVFAAASAGSRVDTIVVQATGTTTAGMVRLFVHDGTNAHLWQEVSVSAVTPSGTQAAFRAELELAQPLLLPNGHSLRAATHNAESFKVIAIGADF